MGRSHKDLHFRASNFPESSARPRLSFTGENNENDIEQDQMDFKTQSLKKHFHKHYMSPTESAKSKAIKKVLGEKNDIQFQRSPSLESGSCIVQSGTSHGARASYWAFSGSNSTSQFDDDELNVSIADSSVKPYDPLTNYLSPRPQYLRYKPNRRREILDRQQALQKEDGSFLERSCSFESKSIVDSIKLLGCDQDFLNPAGSATVHNQETISAENDNGYGEDDEEEEVEEEEEEEEDEEEEEVEEFEEEKRCNLNGVLKFFLLLVVTGLSTSYISSLNFLRTSSFQFEGLKDGCYIVLNNSLEAIPKNMCTGIGVISCTQAGEGQLGFSGANQKSRYQELEKVQMVVDHENLVVVESGDDIAGIIESLNEQNSVISVIGVDKPEAISDHLLNKGTADCKDLDIHQVNFTLPQPQRENIIFDEEMRMLDDGSSQNRSAEGPKAHAATDHELDQMGKETMEKPDSFAVPRGSSGSFLEKDEVIALEKNLVTTKVEGNFIEGAGEDLKNNNGLERTAEVTGTIENEVAHYLVEKVEGISVEKAGEEILPEIVNDEISESSLMEYGNFEGHDGIMLEEARVKLMNARFVEFGTILTACIGFSIFTIILALVCINPARAPSKALQPVKVHFEKSNQKEKLIKVKPSEEIEFLQKKIESIYLQPSTKFFSLEVTRKDLRDDQAPKAELLGELVIGKAGSGSIKRCGRESRTKEAKQSIKAVSHAESGTRSVPLPQSSALDTGSTDSSCSYGSFTAEKKILKKQGARDGSAKMVTTPVRRSSRLQNRSIISP